MTNIRNPYAKPKERTKRLEDDDDDDDDEDNDDEEDDDKDGQLDEQQRETQISNDDQTRQDRDTKGNEAQKQKQQQISADASALIISASDKAGMEGIDRSRIDEIVLRESGNSLFIQQQRKRDSRVNERIHQMKRRLLHASKDQLVLSAQMEKQLQSCKLQQHQSTASSWSRSTCVVVDMDMFYMACELLTRPDLVDKPACVGRGMILTSNYCARRYGVRSAMAGFIADKLVQELSGGKQELIHVKSNFKLYKEKANMVRTVLSGYDPNLRAYSLDEAYLDVGPYLAILLKYPNLSHSQIVRKLTQQLHASPTRQQQTELNTADSLPSTHSSKEDGDKKYHQVPTDLLDSFSPHTCFQAAVQVVTDMRQRVYEATGLTCSAGMAPNFMLAKIASDRNKPNGQLALHPTDVLDFLHPLPIRKVPGIGRVTEKLLHAFDIVTVRDLFEQRGLVNFLFPPASAMSLLKASVGCDSFCASDNSAMFGMNDADIADSQEDTAVNNYNNVNQKGISRERTFAPEQSWTQLNARLEDIARLVSEDLSKKNVWAHTITLKVKLHTFDVLTRCRTLPRGVYIQAPEELVSVATEIFKAVRKSYLSKGTKGSNAFSCRLLGVRCSNLIEADDERYSGGERNQPKIELFLERSPLTPVASAAAGASASLSQTRMGPNRYVMMTPKERKKLMRVPTATGSPLGPAKSDKGDASVCNEAMTCPICFKVFSSKDTDNDTLNSHVDSCLNGPIVRKAVQDASFLSEDKKKKKRRLLDFWSV